MPLEIAYELQVIRHALEAAVHEFRARDEHLIKHDVQERAQMVRIAFYLQKQLTQKDYALTPGLVVDCEYNRDGDDYKRLSLLPQREREDIGPCMIPGRVAPDIIVHRRGTNEKNMLVVELKRAHLSRTATEQAAINIDKERIRKFMDQEWYGYKAGALIVVAKGCDEVTENSVTIEWQA